MKRTVTITIEFDDGPWFDTEREEYFPTDDIAYAMDKVNAVVPRIGDEFVVAKLDDEVLVDRNGYVSEEVKKREAEYQYFMSRIGSWLFENNNEV